jgi:hypothetical protein
MKKLILVAAASVLASPAFAGDHVSASRGGIANSATVTQTAGAFAFSQVAQGDHATIEAPHHDPLVQIDSGAFVMPYIDASRGGHVSVHDPIGNVDLTTP